MATALPTVDIYWIQKLLHKNVTLQLCGMRSPLHSQLYYSDVMSHSITMCHPVSRWVETRPFNQPAQYHIRELQWPSAPCTLIQDAAQPPSVTFSMDSAPVFHSWCRGTCITLCWHPFLRPVLYLFLNKEWKVDSFDFCHVPSTKNLADASSGSHPPLYTGHQTGKEADGQEGSSVGIALVNATTGWEKLMGTRSCVKLQCTKMVSTFQRGLTVAVGWSAVACTEGTIASFHRSSKRTAE